jgi:hypothetical protein
MRTGLHVRRVRPRALERRDAGVAERVDERTRYLVLTLDDLV